MCVSWEDRSNRRDVRASLQRVAAWEATDSRGASTTLYGTGKKPRDFLNYMNSNIVLRKEIYVPIIIQDRMIEDQGNQKEQMKAIIGPVAIEKSATISRRENLYK